tara:strand:- start:2345 stop:3562 length:1218 start_codon:yes stop_codon:yes gene_type:complete
METSRDDFVIAIRSAFLKRGTQQRFSIFGLISFSIIFLILGSLEFKATDYVKTFIKEIVYRSSFIISTPENFLKKNYLVIQGHFNLYEQNQKNIVDLQILRSRDLTSEIIRLENIKYKQLIDDYFIKDNEVYAKVLIDKQSPFLKSIVLNKGSRNNIKLGMVVLDDIYLVGKVVEVNYYTARVLLLSDINSKIPVSLQPGDIQAIMSGTGNDKGVLQYMKNQELKTNKKIEVVTSGAGGLFKSGIPIGNISTKDKSTETNEKIINFYKDFTQLKYVKVVSFSKEKKVLDQLAREGVLKIDAKIEKISTEQEALRVLLKQKKIADEIRIKIEEENVSLKNKIFILNDELSSINMFRDKYKDQVLELEYAEMKRLYGWKCKKNFLNKLYKVGTPKFRECVLNKGVKN